MDIKYIAIDSNYDSLNENEVTAVTIDTYIQMTSMNLIEIPKRNEHVLELITYKMTYWQRLIESADKLVWIKSKGYGWAIYKQTKDCGFFRLYRIKPSNDTDHSRETPWEIGNWICINSDKELENIVNTTEAKSIFRAWKRHQLAVNSAPVEFANGRLVNTSVEKVTLFSKGSGCAICGDYATHRASTTIQNKSTVMISISLCGKHHDEAKKYPCILTFFGTLFFLKLKIPELIKLDHIPKELIEPIFSVVASHIEANYTVPKKGNRGWESRLYMRDDWHWLLRLNKLTDYAYMLFNKSNEQLHRIDSAPDHPDVPYGPDHQHFIPNKKKHRIEPSFSYGIPLFDFPLLKRTKKKYKNQYNDRMHKDASL